MSDPVITFALPRSGSTLLTRLLNKTSTISHNERIRYNGELDIIDKFIDIIWEIVEQDNGGIKSEKELEEDKEFLSHYHARPTLEAVDYLKNFWQFYCKSDSKEHNTWGWKMVNYGIKQDDYLTLVENIIEIWPNVKFVFLDRNIDDVVESMLKLEHWGIDKDFLYKRTRKQIENYQTVINSNMERCHLLSHESLLDYNKFSQFLKGLGWQIPEEDYIKLYNNNRSDDVGTITEIIRELNP